MTGGHVCIGNNVKAGHRPAVRARGSPPGRNKKVTCLTRPSVSLFRPTRRARDPPVVADGLMPWLYVRMPCGPLAHLSGLRQCMGISMEVKMSWLERWSGSFPWIFFLVPFFFSKTAIALGMPDFCISPGWKLFYDAAVGQSEGYGLTMSASLLLSPLIMLWQYSTSDAPEVYNRPKALLVAISGMVVFLGFVGALILGLPIESIETPGRGVWAMIILGQFHLVFSLGYGVFVAAGAVIGYSSCMIAWAALNRFIPDGAGG